MMAPVVNSPSLLHNSKIMNLQYFLRNSKIMNSEYLLRNANIMITSSADLPTILLAIERNLFSIPLPDDVITKQLLRGSSEITSSVFWLC